MAAPQNSGRNIREVFGLDYLLSPPTAAAEIAPSQAPDRSTSSTASLIEKTQQAKRLMQRREVLDRLHSLGNGTGELYKLLDQQPSLGMDLPALLTVAGELEKTQLIQVLERERFGNWKIEITPAGRSFLSATSN